MKLLRVIMLLFLLVGVASAQTGAPPFPTSPTLGEEVTGPNGQVYKWDGTKWVAGVAPFVPPDGSLWTTTGLTGVASLGVNGGATIGGNTTIGGNLNVTGFSTHGIATIATLAVTTNLQIASPAQLLFDGFPMGGTCPVGEYVNALSAIGRLTCQPIVGGGGVFVGTAPPASPTAGQLWFNSTDLQTYMWYTDPTSSQWVAVVNMGGSGGGGGPWLPVNNPTYTGVLTGGTALNLPSASDIIWGNPSQPTGQIISNLTPDTNLDFASGAHWNGTAWVADAATAVTGNFTSTGEGFGITINTGLTVGNTFTTTDVALFKVNGLTLPNALILPNVTSSSIYWGSPTTPTGSMVSGGSDNLGLSGGAHYVGPPPTTDWIADAPNAQIISQDSGALGGEITFSLDNGLTVGNAFLPTRAATIDSTGFNIRANTTFQVGAVSIGVTANWTPTIASDATNPTVTYVAQVGKITYIAPNVFLWNFYIDWSAQSGGSGNLLIRGLPVSQTGAGNNFFTATVCGNIGGPGSFTSLGAGYSSVIAQLAPGTNYFNIQEIGVGSLGSANIPFANVGASGSLICQGWGSTV